MYRIGIDTGGTFTDISLIEEDTGKSFVTKVASTPQNPSVAVLNGLEQITNEVNVKNEDLSFFIHGTTVATNALLEKDGVKTALLTTKGFKDIIEIGRQTRPKLYDFRARKSEPLITRNLRFEINERMDATGAVAKDICKEDIEKLANVFEQEQIKSLAICFINAYANAQNEKKAKEILQKILPDLYVTISSDVLPEFKEFERESTTIANAFVLPKIKNYINNLNDEIQKRDIGSDLYIMQSNGGIMSADTALTIPVRTMLSGPAGGVLLGTTVAKNTPYKNIITIDMGGTSLDTALIENGIPQFTGQSEIDGKPIKVPMIEMRTIGAGGGSIAWIDAGGALKVGPKSAGAEPGPVCYGQGGTEPTVSDANVVLGRLNPDELLDGKMKLDSASALKVIKEKIADPLNISVEEAAEGILKVANTNMVRGIRVISVEKGHDTRDFSLMAFGGAGPLHAVEIANELNSKEVIIPPSPGIACAKGMLSADVRHDYVRTYATKISNIDLEKLNGMLSSMEVQGKKDLFKENFTKDTIELEVMLDLRYMSQAYEISIPINQLVLSEEALQYASNDFHKMHYKVYGFSREEEELELVNIRLVARGLIKELKLEGDGNDKSIGNVTPARRNIYFNGDYYDTPIYKRKDIASDDTMLGPAVIEQLDSTIVVHPNQNVTADEMGNLIISIQ